MLSALEPGRGGGRDQEPHCGIRDAEPPIRPQGALGSHPSVEGRCSRRRVNSSMGQCSTASGSTAFSASAASRALRRPFAVAGSAPFGQAKVEEAGECRRRSTRRLVPGGIFKIRSTSGRRDPSNAGTPFGEGPFGSTYHTSPSGCGIHPGLCRSGSAGRNRDKERLEIRHVGI